MIKRKIPTLDRLAVDLASQLVRLRSHVRDFDPNEPRAANGEWTKSGNHPYNAKNHNGRGDNSGSGIPTGATRNNKIKIAEHPDFHREYAAFRHMVNSRPNDVHVGRQWTREFLRRHPEESSRLNEWDEAFNQHFATLNAAEQKQIAQLSKNMDVPPQALQISIDGVPLNENQTRQYLEKMYTKGQLSNQAQDLFHLTYGYKPEHGSLQYKWNKSPWYKQAAIGLAGIGAVNLAGYGIGTALAPKRTTYRPTYRPSPSSFETYARYNLFDRRTVDYDPNEPRLPNGEWTSGGGSPSGGSAAPAPSNPDTEMTPEAYEKWKRYHQAQLAAKRKTKAERIQAKWDAQAFHGPQQGGLEGLREFLNDPRNRTAFKGALVDTAKGVPDIAVLIFNDLWQMHISGASTKQDIRAEIPVAVAKAYGTLLAGKLAKRTGGNEQSGLNREAITEITLMLADDASHWYKGYKNYKDYKRSQYYKDPNARHGFRANVDPDVEDLWKKRGERYHREENPFIFENDPDFNPGKVYENGSVGGVYRRGKPETNPSRLLAPTYRDRRTVFDYDPSERRVPKGQPGGGQWTEGSNPSTAKAGSAKTNPKGSSGIDPDKLAELDAQAQELGYKDFNHFLKVYTQRQKMQASGQARVIGGRSYDPRTGQEYETYAPPRRTRFKTEGEGLAGLKNFVSDPNNRKAFTESLKEAVDNTVSLLPIVTAQTLAFNAPRLLSPSGRAQVLGSIASSSVRFALESLGFNLSRSLAVRTGTEEQGYKRAQALQWVELAYGLGRMVHGANQELKRTTGMGIYGNAKATPGRVKRGIKEAPGNIKYAWNNSRVATAARNTRNRTYNDPIVKERIEALKTNAPMPTTPSTRSMEERLDALHARNGVQVKRLSEIDKQIQQMYEELNIEPRG